MISDLRYGMGLAWIIMTELRRRIIVSSFVDSVHPDWSGLDLTIHYFEGQSRPFRVESNPRVATQKAGAGHPGHFAPLVAPRTPRTAENRWLSRSVSCRNKSCFLWRRFVFYRTVRWWRAGVRYPVPGESAAAGQWWRFQTAGCKRTAVWACNQRS